MDVEAEEGTEEVQNREAGGVDWTLKQWKARRSPKSGSWRRELDVKAEDGTEEVQNREVGGVNWTLEQRKAQKKSKTGKQKARIHMIKKEK